LYSGGSPRRKWNSSKYFRFCCITQNSVLHTFTVWKLRCCYVVCFSRICYFRCATSLAYSLSVLGDLPTKLVNVYSSGNLRFLQIYQRLVYHFYLRFIGECDNERIISIGPHLRELWGIIFRDGFLRHSVAYCLCTAPVIIAPSRQLSYMYVRLW